MKEIKVEIRGITPLLMNSPQSMIDDATGTKIKSTNKKRDIKKEAKKLAYKDKKGLYVPSVAIKGCLIGASSYKKLGKYAARPIIAGGVIIEGEKIYLNKKNYDLDIRTVVIQRNRVVKARPKIDKWKLKFTLKYNEDLIGNPEIIKKILEEGGKRVGILDFRPQKLGSFGMFEVTKWEEQ